MPPGQQGQRSRHPAAGLHGPHHGDGDHTAKGLDQPFVGHQFLAANKSACSYAPVTGYPVDGKKHMRI